MMINDVRTLKAFSLVRKVVRIALPASLRARIRRLMFLWLDLSWQRSSGVVVRLSSYGDWILYNTIFVSGEYDAGIIKALATAETGHFHVVDLGANVGLFSLRFVDLFREVRPNSADFTITLVEGNPRLIEELRSRIVTENRLSDHVRIIHGLVGEPSGTAILYGGEAARDRLLDSSILRNDTTSGPRVDYVNLTPLLASEREIDLLKCDIEGAELLFIQNYPGLLRKTRVAVFELHHDLCDTDLCRRMLEDAGFSHYALLRRDRANSIYCVWR